MNRPLKIALIGCGRAAERIYLPALKRLRGIETAAAVDPVEQRRSLIAARFDGCVPYDSVREDTIEAVDAAIITTPPDSHVELASGFLKRNRFVLVEKPLARSMLGIRELAEAERASKGSIMMGFNHRFWPPIGRLKDRLARDGGFESAEMVFTSDYDKWDPVSYSSDPLDDLGPHVFDLIRFVFNGEIHSVSARYRDEKTMDLRIGIAGNGSVACRLSHANDTLRSVRVAGADGAYYVAFKSMRITPSSGGIRNILDLGDRMMTKLLRRPFPFNRSYEEQLKLFAGYVRSGAKARPGIEDGIAAIHSGTAARLSLENNGREIRLNEVA